jgi:hypothetical protein
MDVSGLLANFAIPSLKVGAATGAATGGAVGTNGEVEAAGRLEIPAFADKGNA